MMTRRRAVPAQSRSQRPTLLADSAQGGCPARFLVPRSTEFAACGRFSRPRADERDAYRQPGVRRCRTLRATASLTWWAPHPGPSRSGAVRNRDASAGFLDSPARGTYQARVARGRRELLAAATTPLPRRSPLELVEEPIVLVHAASHGPPARARACANPPAVSIAGNAKGPQGRPGGNRPVAGTRTVSRCTCRERLVAALCHGASASVTRRRLWSSPPSASCTRRARWALDTHREAFETAHDRRVPVAGRV